MNPTRIPSGSFPRSPPTKSQSQGKACPCHPSPVRLALPDFQTSRLAGFQIPFQIPFEILFQLPNFPPSPQAKFPSSKTPAPEPGTLAHQQEHFFQQFAGSKQFFSFEKKKSFRKNETRKVSEKKVVTSIVWVFMKVFGCTSCTAFQMYWQKGRRPRTREGLVAGVPCVSDLPVLLPGKKCSLTLASKGFAGLPVRRP